MSWRCSRSACGAKRRSDSARPDACARRGDVLVYGAGRAGSAVAREIVESPELGYELRGFVDDDAAKWGKEIHGVPVLGGRHDVARLVGPGLREIVLAIPSLDAAERREILSHCRRAGAHVRIVPGLADLLRTAAYVHQIRDVRVEDLLPRESVELDETEVREQLTGETVLVTGAAWFDRLGTLPSDPAARAAAAPPGGAVGEPALLPGDGAAAPADGDPPSSCRWWRTSAIANAWNPCYAPTVRRTSSTRRPTNTCR